VYDIDCAMTITTTDGIRYCANDVAVRHAEGGPIVAFRCSGTLQTLEVAKVASIELDKPQEETKG